MQPTHQGVPALLRIGEAAHELRVSRATIYRLISAGDLTPVHVGPGRSARIERAEIDHYIDRHRAKASA